MIHDQADAAIGFTNPWPTSACTLAFSLSASSWRQDLQQAPDTIDRQYVEMISGPPRLLGLHQTPEASQNQQQPKSSSHSPAQT